MQALAQNTYDRKVAQGRRGHELTEAARENRRHLLPARRHLRRLCRRLCGSEDVRRRRRRGHGWERCRQLRTCPHGRRRPPGGCGLLCPHGLPSLPAPARAQERGARNAGLRRTGGRHHPLNAVFQFEGLRVATDSAYAAAFGTAGRMPWCCSCSTSSTTGPSARRSSLACGWRRSAISPTNQGCSPSRWASYSSRPPLLPRGPARGVPGPRLWQADPRVLVIVPAIAEIWMVLYLLVKEVRSPRPTGLPTVAEVGVAA